MPKASAAVEKRRNEFAQAAAAFLGLEPPNNGKDYSIYAIDPIGFIEQELGVWLTEDQRAIATSVRDARETNVQASHGCGKTFLAACLALWWVLAVGGLCITTAPTKRQVVELLWGEIRKAHGRLNLPGERGQTFLRLTEEARAYGFTASPTNSNAFQGVHHEKLLIIEDEACGITPDIDEGAASCATGAKNRILRIGNPIITNVPFQKSCARKHIRIPAWSHINVAWAYDLHDDGIHRLKSEVAALILNESGDVKPQDEWDASLPRDRVPGAVSINWIEDVRRTYGEGSSYWQSRVEGLFALDAAQSIIPRAYFIAARQRYDDDPEYWDKLAEQHSWQHGMDVGDGIDYHAMSSWRGPVLYSIGKMATKGDREDQSRAARWAYKTLEDKPGTIGIDQCGCGAGALSEAKGLLTENRLDSDIAFGINFGGAADNEDDQGFIAQDLKTELYWGLREAMRRGEVAIAPLGDLEDEAMEDLAGIYWEETRSGKTRLEEKKFTRKRLKRSPDIADSIIYGWATPPEPEVWAIGESTWGY